MSVDPLVTELEVIRKREKISRSLCSKLLKIPETTFFRWSCGLHQPSPYYKREIQKLLAAIKKIKEK